MPTRTPPGEPTTPALGLLPSAGVAVAAVLLFGVQLTVPGLAVLAVSLAAAYLIDRGLATDLGLIALGLCTIATTSVEADIRWGRFFLVGAVLLAAVTLPTAVDHLVLRRGAIIFPWRGGGRWTRFQWGYVVAVPFLAWLILPFYFITSGAYANWPPIRTASEIGRFFVGVNAVGLWDEMFFICVVFALLRRHFAMWTANLLMATMFVSFLWELGYREWGPFLTVPFALLQGFIFTRTKSLTYVVLIHLLFDAIVFLAICHAHDPSMFPIFPLVPR